MSFGIPSVPAGPRACVICTALKTFIVFLSSHLPSLLSLSLSLSLSLLTVSAQAAAIDGAHDHTRAAVLAGVSDLVPVGAGVAVPDLRLTGETDTFLIYFHKARAVLDEFDPPSSALLAAGALGLLIARRRQRRQSL